jgi:glycosyltransferase involved in cell wall biosynthesis
MKIAINCWVLRNKDLDGIGYYTVNAVSNLIKDHPEVHFQILCDKNFTEPYFDFPNASKHHIFPALRHPVLYVLYIQLKLYFFLTRHKPDLFLSLDGFINLFTKTKQVPVIHDINFEHQPEGLKLMNRFYFRFFFKRFARKANRIATVSEFTKQDVVDLYQINPAKIDNVSGGINSNFFPLTEEEKSGVRKKWSDGKSYFFFVGSMHPRKNIPRLIEAFDLFKKETNSDFKLILGGAILWNKGEIQDAFSKSSFRDDIVFTGRLSENDLQKLLGAAHALSFVPVFEGFGLPIVEAFQSGVPILCSNITSMPEVAGDAALLVDPYKIESISSGLKKLASDKAFCSALVEKGNVRKNFFSWKRTASLIWDCINKTLHENPTSRK